ncbi:hypothetical protein GCM10009790_20040 [Georgenia ruanii]
MIPREDRDRTNGAGTPSAAKEAPSVGRVVRGVVVSSTKGHFSQQEVTAGISAVRVIGGRAAGAVAVLCDVGTPVTARPGRSIARDGRLRGWRVR